MQTLQPRTAVPPHPNIVELAALLEDNRLKAAQRHRLESALFDALRLPDGFFRQTSTIEAARSRVG